MKLDSEAAKRIGSAVAHAKPKEALAIGLGAVAREVFAVVEQEMEALREKVKRVEGKGLSYAGTWQRALGYVEGDVVTYDGSAWVCLSPETKAKPGDGADWQLFVKKGRDAK